MEKIRTIQRATNGQRGITMLLALLLLAALTAAGVGASVIVLTEFRTTSSTDESIRAYYAADSAMEQGLYTIFRNRLLGESYLGTTLELQGASGSLPSIGATYDLSGTTNTESTKTVSLLENQTVQFNLFEPDAPFFPGPNIARTITLSSPSMASENTGAWAEVQSVYILRTGFWADFTTNATVRLVSNAKFIDPIDPQARIDLYANALVSGSDIPQPGGITPQPLNVGDISGWIVRVKALYGGIPDLTLTACRDTNSPCGTTYQIPSDLALVAQGSWRNSRTRLDAKVPWQLPSTGLLDFVIFSEGSLDKPGT